ncbi:hypothetical protein E5S67_05955 [Microcoleus sp. IPMA8]|uniref:Uncharacterized protein n=1 Tax=Microcoleus asticus IPMA8 TaxID=2563858 RepID=A0ABX2D676_9CYAN|nr:hypothetical protein [Microcoleus asticus IPMA8]
MRNYHVPFCRAVEEATPSLTLILKRLGLGIFPRRKRRSGNLSIVGTIDDSTAKEILHTLHRAAKMPTS